MTTWRYWWTMPLLIGGGILFPGLSAPEANADGVLTDAEAGYVTTYGEQAICPTLDSFPSTSGVLGVLDGIGADGFTPDNAVDVLNAAVWEYCPRHWPMLVEIGEAARQTPRAGDARTVSAVR